MYNDDGKRNRKILIKIEFPIYQNHRYHQNARQAYGIKDFVDIRTPVCRTTPL